MVTVSNDVAAAVVCETAAKQWKTCYWRKNKCIEIDDPYCGVNIAPKKPPALDKRPFIRKISDAATDPVKAEAKISISADF